MSALDIMSTVSPFEFIAPISFRTCSTLNSKLVNKRIGLQRSTSENRLKPGAAGRPDVPCVQGVSLYPALIGCTVLDIERKIKWPAECTYNDDWNDSTSSSSDEFSDEDLNEMSGSQEVSRILSHDQHKLQIVGSKPKLHSMFEVPVIKSTPNVDSRQRQGTCNSSDPEFIRDCTSPENPPPSPINFATSLDNFVVGGKKLTCPAKIRHGNNARDFRSGFVKYPLFHCNKCEVRAMDEINSPATIRRRYGEVVRNLAQGYKLVGNMMPADQLSYISRPESQRSLLDCEHDARSFLEIYTKKRKQREQQEMERKTSEEARGHNVDAKPEYSENTRDKVQSVGSLQNKRDDSRIDARSSFNDGSNDSLTVFKQQSKRLFNQALTKSSESSLQSASDSCSKPTGQRLGNVSDLSYVDTIEEQDIPRSKAFLSVTSSDAKLSIVDKCQVRPCRSDIWPFVDDRKHNFLLLDDFKKIEKARSQTPMKGVAGVGLGTIRNTPCHPLVPGLSIRKCDIHRQLSPTSSNYTRGSSCREVKDENGQEADQNQGINKGEELGEDKENNV